MTIGEALKRRLEIYDPAECKRWERQCKRITASTTPASLLLELPGFKCDMRRVVPIRLRRRWITRQLQLAIKEAIKWHGKQKNIA